MSSTYYQTTECNHEEQTHKIAESIQEASYEPELNFEGGKKEPATLAKSGEILFPLTAGAKELDIDNSQLDQCGEDGLAKLKYLIKVINEKQVINPE